MTATKRTSLFLMANLGAEVSRIISAKNRNDEISSRLALIRAQNILREIEIMDDMKPRIEEIKILSSVINAITNPQSKFYAASRNIEGYFTPFALRLAATQS